MLINSIITFCLIISILYAGFILFVVLISILRAHKQESNNLNLVPVSIIVPYRNESENLNRLCESLENQNYLNSEIIFVNDHSTDDSEMIINSYDSSKFKINRINLPENELGKKTAIEKGVNTATNDKIICLDADCFPVSKDWISNMVKSSQNVELFGGPVYLEKSRNLWKMIQAIEMFATQIISFSMSKIKSPMAISGANLSYSKKTFIEINPYSGNKETASGDDIYFLQALKKNGKTVNQEIDLKYAVCTTSSNLKKYFYQRIRWMRKSSSFKDFTTIFVGLLIFFGLLSFLFGAVYQIIMNELNLQLMISMGVKMGIDFLLLFLIAIKFRRVELLLVFVPAFLFSLVAFFGVILFGWFIPVSWKNRKI